MPNDKLTATLKKEILKAMTISAYKSNMISLEEYTGMMKLLESSRT